MTTYEPFNIEIPEEAISDLNKRLKRTRLASEFANDNWDFGTNGAYLQELLRYWEDGYDWRLHERAMNQYGNYKTTIDNIPIHFLYEKGKGPDPTPLILTHGWPWTFWDWEKVVGPLTDPAAFGGDPKDSFDVIVPSLPGFGFSTPLTATGINFWRSADLWVSLMRDVLGYDRFAAAGGDWGSLTTAQLGHKYGEHLIGVYLLLMAPLTLFNEPLSSLPEESEFSEDEAGWYERNQNFFVDGSGYSAIQSTRPQTIAYAMNDSPAGLCAWLLEKRRSWSDCAGNVETRFTKDELLTGISIYWFTQSYGTTARYYYECTHNKWSASHGRHPVVEAPVGVGVYSGEAFFMPKSWAEQYYNLQHWTRMSPGGHFAPMEEPETLTVDIRKFFRSFRG